MRVYLAGETPMDTYNPTLPVGSIHWAQSELTRIIPRRLHSYYYHGFKTGNRLDREVQVCIDAGMEMFLDSGAFSAHTQGETIDIDRYAKFIHEHGKHFAVKANLDDIGDTGPRSWENLVELNDRQGCGVFPVFHANDDYAYLTRMIDAGYKFMALGGLVGASRKVLRDWLDGVWGNYLIKSDGTPRLKVHGFGLTDTELMIRYPWYSVDSSSWIMTGVFGGCIFREKGSFFKVSFSQDNPDKYNINGWHYSTLNEHQKRRVDGWLAPLQVTAEQLSQHYSYRNIVNANTFVGIEQMDTPATFAIQQPTLESFFT